MNLREQWHDQVKRCLPDLFSKPATVLYIGAKVKKNWAKGMEFVDKFLDAGCTIDVVEAWAQNVAALQHFNQHGRQFRNEYLIEPGTFQRIIHGDISKLDTLDKLGPEKYDIVFWWHGPEHAVTKLPRILRRLETLASRLIVIGCPWGIYKQKAVGGNEHERHGLSLYPEFFTGLGWNWDTIGEIDIKKNNLLAWKRIEKEAP